MRPADNLNESIKKLQLRASTDLDARVHEKISGALAHREKKQLVRSEPNLWRTIMKGKTAKLAAAAVILVSVLVSMIVFMQTSESVVLAGVLEKVEQSRAFSYKMDMTMTGSMVEAIPTGIHEIHTTTIVSTEYGMKYEMDMGITDPETGEAVIQEAYILPDQKVMISLMPQQKKFMRVELDDDLLAETKKKNNDPREMLKQILDCEYTELGRSKINGIEVEGFETTDPKYAAGMGMDVKVTLWVDLKTWLPVLMEMDMKMKEQMSMHGIISDFQWDIPVAASDFEPVIPEDFTSLIDGDYKMPAMTEEAALEGLKLFADMSGKYPKKIDMMSLTKEFSALYTEDRAKLKEKIQQSEGQDTMKATVTKTMEMMRPVQSLAMFYMKLVQEDKEPVYYGEKVGPDGAGAVLMRWKVSDGLYRVVFGDLLTSNVSSEELAVLETQ